MNSILTSFQSLGQMFDSKIQEFKHEIDSVHMVWLEEIQQEANRMFSSDFNAEPELMPKTPSQKKNSRRKRVSLGRQEERQARRFSKGRRSNLRGSAVKTLELVEEVQSVPEDSCSEPNTSTQSKRPTRKKKQTKPASEEELSQPPSNSCQSKNVENKKPELKPAEDEDTDAQCEAKPCSPCVKQPSPEISAPKVMVSISPAERLAAELSKKPDVSPGRNVAKIAIAGKGRASRRSSVRCSLKLRHSVAGLRHSRTTESLSRASRRSMAKKKAARLGNSTCSSNISNDSCIESPEEDEAGEPMQDSPPEDTVDAAPESPEKTPEIAKSLSPPAVRITRSVAVNSPSLTSSQFPSKQKMLPAIEKLASSEEQSVRRSSRSTKRKAPDTVEASPSKRLSPPKKSHSAVRPNMKSFLHTVQKNQMLMMTPNSFGRTTTIKSFIKHTTPLRLDPKTKERHKLEALKKKQEQEEERMRKMEEEKKKKQEELKRKRDERLKRVFEAKVKEEQKEEEKKKRIEQKMVKIDEKNDKRLVEDRAKKKVAQKRQEELEMKKKMEEEAKKKKQAEEEKRQQELMAMKKAEEEEQARLAEARRAQERERQAAAEREHAEKEKALALQREVERAAREKERRELEEKRKALEQKRKLEEQQWLAAKEKEAAALKTSATLNATMDVQRSHLNTPVGKAGGLNVTFEMEATSPQSYMISPKGGSNPSIMSKHLENYGMDQNSDDSTDDEAAPRKPIPSWAEGHHLQQIIMKQYFNPPDFDSFFGAIEPPKLENIFYKSKPRYFKRTSSAVWHSPLAGGK